tara:strand:+ start:59 stop:721 length:663 start_codon:yes stop_codon:yes gene_type:complete
MDKKTEGLFPTVDKDILQKMDEDVASLEVNIADLPKKKKILKHSNVFVDDKPVEEKIVEEREEREEEVVKNEPPAPKKKTYPHLAKGRAKAKANREAKKQAKLAAKLGKKTETRERRLDKQRISSKERYWKKKEEEDNVVSKEVFMNITKEPTHADGLTYSQFRKYQSQYETEKNAERIVIEKRKLEEENKRLKKQISTNNSFNRSSDYPDYFNTGNRFY